MENFFLIHTPAIITFLSMTIVLSALAFFVLLSVLILIHEWGHYIAARLSGVEVEEFGFGLPPRAKTMFKRKGTQFTLNWVPFGGFVRLKGENVIDEKQRRKKGSFAAAPIPQRILILIAGVFMNFILSIALLTYGFSFGQWVPTYTTTDQMEAANARGEIALTLGVRLAEISEEGGAGLAGVPTGSYLLAVDGEPVTKHDEVVPLQEGKRRVVYTVQMEESEPQEFTVNIQDGKAGVLLTTVPRNVVVPERSPGEAFLLALRESKVVTLQAVQGIGQLFFSLAQLKGVPEGITGVVGIAQMTHVSVLNGWTMYLRLVAVLSLSLAVLNILPIPALDGGRLLFVLAELISRRPINREFELTTNAIGFFFLLFLIVLITFHDIVSLF